MAARALGLLTFFATALAACNLEEPWIKFGQPDEGRLVLAVTDAPADFASEVVLTFTGVEFRDADGEPHRFQLDEAVALDLLTLQESRRVLLDRVELEPGRYQSVRLLVDASSDATTSYVMLQDGNQFPLAVTADDGALAIASGFVMPDDELLDLTVDIDLRKGLTRDPEQDYYVLAPAARLVRTEETGTLAGSVDPQLVNADNCSNGPNNATGNAVYLFSGHSVTPDDLDGSGDAVASVPVRLGADGLTYRAAYLAPGAYTAAFTCQGADDDPLTDDQIVFSSAINATISAEETTTVDFAPR
jgi:hypothetical protein